MTIAVTPSVLQHAMANGLFSCRITTRHNTKAGHSSDLDPVPPSKDTDEVLATPVLGPLAREAVRRVEPGSRPEDVVPPISTLPGLPLRIPSPFPIPNFARLYFRHG